jgi:lysozyme
VILSAAGRALIKGFEHLALVAYPDGVDSAKKQRYSIGYGHNGVGKDDRITAVHAEQLFDGDVARFERRVSSVLAAASQCQFDACCSLCYNIGEDAFSKSTLAIKHNAGDFVGAAAQFARWNKSQGAVHPGLVLRRERERSVYECFTGGAPWSGGSTSGPSSGFQSIANPIGTPPLRTTGNGALLVVGAVFFCPCS